jgi:hypothetical protein
MAAAHSERADASSDDADHPSVWIELGGQLERNDGGQDAFLPPFTRLSPTPTPYSPISPAQAQRPTAQSYGAEGKISFEPGGDGWIFSAAVRYGRSATSRDIHQQSMSQTPNINHSFTFGSYVFTFPSYSSYPKFANFLVKNRESHAIVDFKVGRDVGVGLFGREGSAKFDVGVRFAQFSSKSSVNMIVRPEVHFTRVELFPGKYSTHPIHDDFMATANNDRNFHGVGPSISFDGSAALFGSSDTASIGIDWGLNAAVLFGRQKASGNQSTTKRHYEFFVTTSATAGPPPVYQHSTSHNRTRAVTVPNIGGFAGISFRYPNAKMSFGYRADFFFGAIDGGVETRHTVDRNFYGPFATISVGL